MSKPVDSVSHLPETLHISPPVLRPSEARQTGASVLVNSVTTGGVIDTLILLTVVWSNNSVNFIFTASQGDGQNLKKSLFFIVGAFYDIFAPDNLYKTHLCPKLAEKLGQGMLETGPVFYG